MATDSSGIFLRITMTGSLERCFVSKFSWTIWMPAMNYFRRPVGRIVDSWLARRSVCYSLTCHADRQSEGWRRASDFGVNPLSLSVSAITTFSSIWSRAEWTLVVVVVMILSSYGLDVRSFGGKIYYVYPALYLMTRSISQRDR